MAVAGRAVAPKLVFMWQLAHWVDTETLLWKLAGVQLLVPALWQLSQLAIDTPLRLLYGMWLADSPLAGGKPPVWQLAHWLATGVCVWFHLLGFQPVTLWQLMQLAVVGMCVEVLPAAELPLWQLVQLVALLNRLCSGFDPDQVLVDLWQFSQVVWPLWMAVAGRAVAPKLVFIWQLAHCALTETLL